MKNGHCPMCNSEQVYKNESVLFRAHGGILELEDDDGEDPLHFNFTPYICLDCGFTALYADYPDNLSVVRKAKDWKKVS